MAAEAIVSLAIERISDLLMHEALFLEDVKEEVESLKAELKRMQCFLKDVDRKQEQGDRLRNRVSEIRDLAYEAEDVIDSFILEAAHQRGFYGICMGFISIFTKLFHQHKIRVEIKAIKAKLENISRSLPAFELPGDGAGYSSVSRTQQRLRRTFSHVEEEDVVSLEVSTKDVLAQLMAEEDRVHAVVSIVGMGGIGKTTLARKVYNHADVKRRFDCLAWVSISQQCNTREVLHDVLMKVQPRGESIGNLTESQLIKRLSDVLKEKLYLVVFDDIWKSEDWDILKPAFPRGKKGSKILFTTSNKDVALQADPRNSPMELPLLTDDESWNLLSRKAFPGNKTDSYADSEAFEKLGRDMVKKCGGLPLAIVVLGGLLAAKPTQGQWEMVRRNIFKGFKQQGHQYGSVNAILALSYNDLPYHLKPCFLYLGQYPEDWEISEELIRLWIAKGFISPSLESRDMLMEDVGEQFLEELVNRSLVQLGRLDHTGTKVKTCRIHDLLRDLCIEKAREEKFLEIVGPLLTESGVKLVEPMQRRIAIHPSKMHDCCLKGKHKKLRSLLLFQNVGLIEMHISKCKNFKILRVLNLVRKHGDWRVSSEIGNLHHLRYLKLEGDEIILLRAMGRLKSLHTLYIQYLNKLAILNAVFDLEHLRHIVLRERLWVADKPCLLPWLTSKKIETLKYIAVDKKLIETGALRRLVYIQRLGMTFKRAKDLKPMLMLLIELHRLGSLSMNFLRHLVSYSDLEPLSHCHRLSKLKLIGEIKEDAHQSHHVLKFLPPNIVKLSLYRCWMEQDQMCVLEKLPCLRILKLQYNTYAGTKMICSANGFPQLDYLGIYNL